jgi:hypothetical protein
MGGGGACAKTGAATIAARTTSAVTAFFVFCIFISSTLKDEMSTAHVSREAAHQPLKALHRTMIPMVRRQAGTREPRLNLMISPRRANQEF